MVEAMKDADFVISHISAISSEAVNNAGHLSAVCILRSGVENVNVPNATTKGVKVINTPGRLAVPVSEFTVGLIISEIKNIARSHVNMIKGDFSKKFYNREFNYSISGNKVGVIGYGAIGRRVAAIMKVLGAKVLVFDPYIDKNLVTDDGFEYVTLNELFKESDVVSVHYRLTEETKGLIGKEQFALMKPHAFFFNTARAGLVDETALIDTLVNHRIGGAGLDVFHQEPLPPDHPFLTLDNVTLTAHLAGTSSDSFKTTCAIMEDAIRHYFRDGVWKNTVN
jgi:D-3-phosphoglycerate dehydrogenase